MTTPLFISADMADATLNWPDLVDALWHYHQLEAAHIKDLHLSMANGGLLNRAAWIKGLGAGLKTVSVFPNNPNTPPYLPTVQGVFVLYSEQNGAMECLIDGATITRWKTVADSLLGAKLLANPESKTLLIVGAGKIASTLASAYPTLFPHLERILIWNRTYSKAQQLAESLAAQSPLEVTAHSSLNDAISAADIISSATLSVEPIIEGASIRPGSHVDLIGAYRADMREADDQALHISKIFVDSRATTIGEIGELMIPIAAGTLHTADVLADLYQLAAGAQGRTHATDITLYKNGGGAHLDLMTARHILEKVQLC